VDKECSTWRIALGARGWWVAFVLLAPHSGLLPAARGEIPTYTIDQGVALAEEQNPEIIVARKKLEAAHGGLIEARAGYLPSIVSAGYADKRETQTQTQNNLRNEDYNASIRALENIYTGGAVSNAMAIAKLNIEKQAYQLEETKSRVAMNVRIAFYDLLLNRAKVRVHQDSVGVLEEELKSQQQRLRAGTVGILNVQRAQVALANEQPDLVDAETQLKDSYLQLGELFGLDFRSQPDQPRFEIAGNLEYQGGHPDLNECLAHADVERPEIKEGEIDVKIEEHQYAVDRSELLPHVQMFSGYEAYSERDPAVGPEFNHGYLVGVNASWHLFDGFATMGRMRATRARRDAAVETLKATRRSVASEVRSAFLDLQQAERVLESETKSVQTADQSLEIAKANLAAGLGTQLDVLQAAADVTRTRTTRLSAIYLHNVALARLAHACSTTPDALKFEPPTVKKAREARDAAEALAVARPPKKLGHQ
jgi:outer membrane protein